MWRTVCLILGILLIFASIIIYIGQVTSCYPSAATWQKFSDPEKTAMNRTCRLTASATSRFAEVFWLLVLGMPLFSSYWMWAPSQVKAHRSGALTGILILLMLFCLGIILFGLLSYPVPQKASAPAVWVVEMIAVLGASSYIGLLALWRWKRWGAILFLAASIGLVIFLFFGVSTPLIGGMIVLGILALLVFLLPIRHKLV